MKDDLLVFLANIAGIPLFLSGAAALHYVAVASVVTVQNTPLQAIAPVSVVIEEDPLPALLEKPAAKSEPVPVLVPIPAPAVVTIEPESEPAPAELIPVKQEKKTRRTRAS